MKRLKEKLKRLLMKLVLGTPVKGESIGEPTFKTVYPDKDLEINQFFNTLTK